MNGALEAIEGVMLAGHHDFKSVLVCIATGFAFCHSLTSRYVASWQLSSTRVVQVPCPTSSHSGIEAICRTFRNADRIGTRLARWMGIMLSLKSVAQFATVVALFDCRYDDRPPAVAPAEPANPAEAPEPRVPAPDFPPERSEVDLDTGPGTGPVASVLGVGGSAGTGGVGGAGGLSGSGGAAATHPQPIH